MQKKHLFFAGCILCLVIAGWGYYRYQKPRADASQMTASFSLTAAQLYTEYSTKEAVADKKYGSKIIEVTGIVKEVQPASGGTNILIAADSAGGVNCSFQNTNSNAATIGEPIKVKGMCTGFLMDVSLVDAVRMDK